MKAIGLICILILGCLAIPSSADLLCPRPKIPSYGFIRSGQKRKYTVGSVVTFACKHGYRLHGQSSVKCLKRGIIEYWNKHSPICRPVVEKGTLYII